MRTRSLFGEIMRGAALLAVLASLGACGGTSLTAPARIGDEAQARRTPDATRGYSDAVNFFREAPVTLLETSGTDGFQLVMEGGDRVPDVTVAQVNAAPMKFGALLDQISRETGLSWRISGPGTEALMQRDVFMVQRNETPLSVILNELSRITDSFITMSGDRIVVSQDQLFVARVPRMEDSQDVLVEGLRNVGATEIFRDKLSGTVTFRARRPVFEAAQRLMRSLEGGRDMIVYDFWLIERALADRQSVGASLSLGSERNGVSLTGASLTEAFTSTTPAGVFVSGNLGSVGVEGAVRFIRELGDTSTISRPTISLLSGASSSFRTGERQQYIKSVQSSSSESITSSGTDVETLETGLTINVTGTHNGGVISTRVRLDLTELLEFQEFETGSVTLRLPRTSDRTLEANLEARPGDVMVLGGIIRDVDTKSGTTIPGTGIQPSLNRSSQKSETIILVRPRLVQIRPTGRAGAPRSSFVQSGVHDLHSRPAPNARRADAAALVEDEARAQRVLGRLQP